MAGRAGMSECLSAHGWALRMGQTMRRSQNRRTPSRPDFVSLRRSALPHDFLEDSKDRRDGLPETRMMPIVLPIKQTSRNRTFRNHVQDVPGEWQKGRKGRNQTYPNSAKSPQNEGTNQPSATSPVKV